MFTLFATFKLFISVFSFSFSSSLLFSDAMRLNCTTFLTKNGVMGMQLSIFQLWISRAGIGSPGSYIPEEDDDDRNLEFCLFDLEIQSGLEIQSEVESGEKQQDLFGS